MESGVVKLTPQWLSFTNNQPQDDQKRNGLQEGHRERYGDRTRYNNFSGRTSQSKIDRNPDVRSSSGSINTGAGASPPRLGRSKSLNTLKKEPNAETPPVSQPTPTPTPPPTTEPVTPSPSVPDVRASSPPIDSSSTPAGPPKSSYDKHFPALSAQKKSKSTPTGLVSKKEKEDSTKSPPAGGSPARTASPPLASTSSIATSTNSSTLKTIPKANPSSTSATSTTSFPAASVVAPTPLLAPVSIPVIASTSTPATTLTPTPIPTPSSTTVLAPTIPSTTPIPTSIPISVIASTPVPVNNVVTAQPTTPNPPGLTKQKSLTSWTGPSRSDAKLPITSAPTAVLVSPVVSPTPVMAPVAASTSPFRSAAKVVAPVATGAKVVAASPSPSPPPMANAGKSPAVIIREAPKAAPAKVTVAPVPTPTPTPSYEIERAKSLVPSQPIVPKPLAKNRNDHHQNAKNQSKNQQNAQNAQRTKRLVKKSTAELDASNAFNSILSSADNIASQADQDQREPVKTVQKDPVKLLPRNSFFENLRKQEEQKRKGIPEKEEGATPNENGAVKSENGHATNGDTRTVSPPLESKPVEPEVKPQAPESQPETPQPAQPQEATQPIKPEPQPAPLNQSSDSLAPHLQLSEEEEQRLLKQFGWNPDDNAGSDDDDYSIPDEEIQALKNQLNLHKESLTQKRETRLNSLAQSVEQWQQRLLSSTTPIKSP